MVEWSPEVCRFMAQEGRIVVDTRDADHEAGDLLQAGLTVSAFASLTDVVCPTARGHKILNGKGPVFFKSCGWAGWDLAAVRCATISFDLDEPKSPLDISDCFSR
jgi:ornithine cyclodeaminase